MPRAFPAGDGHPCSGTRSARRSDGVLGRAALPSLVGAGDALSHLAEALDRGRLGRAFISAARVVVSRRRSGGGAPADVVQRLLAVTGTPERDLSTQAIPRLAEAPGPAWARVRLALEASVALDLRSDAPDPVAAAALEALTGAAWLEDARALAAIDAERLQAGAGLRSPGAHSGRLGPAADVLAAVEARLAAHRRARCRPPASRPSRTARSRASHGRCSGSSRRTMAPRSSMHAAADSSSTRRSSSW